ncbi:recombinase family protein [Actinoplanes sp. NBC_00393]|uniref:recombinase family protein n=1 Tax=Actinoplanes sp. NBC_00393 TaxID=2975953 RepID=UPI002E233742
MAMRDGVYARISEDDLGTEKGVFRQLEDGRGLSKSRGGQVVAEFSDNDLSALTGAHRPGYEALMAAVAAGQIDRIIVVHTSRLWRNRKERADGIERLRAAGVSVLAVKGPELDLTTASGRMMAGILGEFDTAESEIKGERVARAALQRAQEGRANGAVLYGWTRVYRHDDQNRVTGFEDRESPVEAEIVREIVRRLLGGEALRTITDDLNARGVPAPGAGQRRQHRAKGQSDDGARWNKTSVKKIATRPANIGLRIHHRGRPDEMLVTAAWPPLIERDDHDAVVALVSQPDRWTARVSRPGARVHLLSWGIGECGVCGAHVRVAVRGNSKHGTKKPLYVCEGKGCVGRDEARVDLFVGHVVVERLKRPDLADILTMDDGGGAEALKRAEGIRARLANAADDYADEKITAEQLHRITARLKPALAQAETEARAYQVSPHLKVVLDMMGERAEEVWAGMTTTQRHAVLSVLVERVRILRVNRRGPGFDPESIEIVWKTSFQRPSVVSG